MPFVSLNKGSKQFGIQTFARARRLPDVLQGVEMEYLAMRDWYVNQLAIKAQVEEEREQCKRAGDAARVGELNNRLHAISSSLTDFRDRCRTAGEKAWAEAFLIVAEAMLPKEVMKAIGMEADQLLGRQRHELKRRD